MPLAARYSTPFALATCIVRGGNGPDDFRAEALADARIRTLAAKVRVEEDAAMTRLLPYRKITRVSLTLANGRTLTGTTDGSPGDEMRPLSQEQHRGKFLQGAEPLWRHTAPVIYDLCLQVNELPRIKRLTNTFRSGLSCRREP